MKKTETYTTRDGEEFDNVQEAKYHDMYHCTKDNEAFVVSSSFYGQFVGIFKTYGEAIAFIQSNNKDKLRVERVDIGKYKMEHI